MNRLIAAAFLLSTVASVAHAMPLAPADLTPNASIIRVSGGCGPGFHRGSYGGCRQNYANPGAHACPRGFHIGPGGGCRGDGR
jgi:hypothetical protein